MGLWGPVSDQVSPTEDGYGGLLLSGRDDHQYNISEHDQWRT
jgi:hypothetical protein